jgi:membrane protein involved in colicin uptake
MLWLSLRTGFGNTGCVVALALLPLIALASVSRPHGSPRIESAAVAWTGAEAASLPPGPEESVN